MASAIIDSCCLIDLLASGHAEAILRASGHAWRLPIAVQGEVQFVRQRDSNDSGKIISMPVDLSALISAEVLAPCQPDVPAELDLFIRYAARFGSDGESMCLALAENRGWLLATDDKEAMKVHPRADAVGHRARLFCRGRPRIPPNRPGEAGGIHDPHRPSAASRSSKSSPPATGQRQHPPAARIPAGRGRTIAVWQ